MPLNIVSAILNIKHSVEKYDFFCLFFCCFFFKLGGKFCEVQVFSPQKNFAAFSPRSILTALSSCVYHIWGAEPSHAAVATEPSTGPPDRGPGGARASWSFLFHTLPAAPNPWASGRAEVPNLNFTRKTKSVQNAGFSSFGWVILGPPRIGVISRRFRSGKSSL